jgi:hypothetical protein
MLKCLYSVQQPKTNYFQHTYNYIFQQLYLVQQKLMHILHYITTIFNSVQVQMKK